MDVDKLLGPSRGPRQLSLPGVPGEGDPLLLAECSACGHETLLHLSEWEKGAPCPGEPGAPECGNPLELSEGEVPF